MPDLLPLPTFYHGAFSMRHPLIPRQEGYSPVGILVYPLPDNVTPPQTVY